MSKYNSIRVGDRFTNKHGSTVEILERYRESEREYYYRVKFLESGFIRKGVHGTHLKKGQFKDPFKPSVYGVGYLGKETTRKKGEGRKLDRAKRLWQSLICRCYSGRKIYESYSDCTVCDRWLNRENFLQDISQIEGYERWLANKEKMSLDKDMKIPGNRTYSPDAVMFVPLSVNNRDGGRYALFRKLID